jgi:flagellar biosynthetic protein FliP
LFLTAFNMMPVAKQINDTAFQPLMANKMPLETAAEKGLKPLHEFMARQVREKDLALMIELSKQPKPDSIDNVSMWTLVPAFMLSELYAAFQIGFMIFLPFLLIDLVVSAILMSMGMLMVSPMTISLPLKILMFVLVDGWALIVNALMTSFH